MKLALLFVVSAALLFVLDPVTPAVLYFLAAMGVLIWAGLSWRTFVLAQLPFFAFALGVFVVNVLSRPGEVLWQYGALRVTSDGLLVGAALAERTLLTGLLSVAFILTTDGISLMTSLHQHARLDVRVTYAVLAGYRMLQQLGGEWSVILHAQSVRAPLDRHGRPRRGVRRFAAAAFALLVSALRRGERVAQSLESRGLGLSPRTSWRPVPIGANDAWFAAAVVLVLTTVLLIAAAGGVLRGPGALF